MKLRFDALTSWRFVAGFHLVVFHEAISQQWRLPTLMQNVVNAAFMQVTYFFLVSGFVFGVTYSNAVERQTLDLRHFWLSRLARLYPVYALALLLAAPFYLRDLLHDLGRNGAVAAFGTNAVAKLTLTQAWFPGIATTWNPPSWAMSAVAFFYLLFPFVARRIVRLDARQTMRVAIGCVAISLACALAYCTLAPRGWQGNAFDGQTAWTVFMRLNPLIRLPEFVIGICLARLYRLGAFDGIPAGHARTIALGGMALLAVFALASSVVPYMLLHHTLPLVPYSLLLVGLARWEAEGGAGFLRKPQFVRLGNASFSMYILHVPLFLVTGYLSLKGIGHSEGLALAVVNFVLAVVVALAGQRYLEGPSKRWMHRLFKLEAAR